MSRRRAGADVHGVAVIDKPCGWTSHDVVGRSRKLLGTSKIGHSGTLDPGATGVLILGVGRATRLLRYMNDLVKMYEGLIVLGSETNTLDSDGEVTATHDMAGASIDEARRLVADRFVGDIEQIPPMVSAIQIDGKRLHELARAGIEVERPPRPVTIYSYEIAETDTPGIWKASVACSSGTYIRSLAADLGAALGGGAHLDALRRTAIGPFGLEQARELDSFVADQLLPVETAVSNLARADVDEAVAAAVGYGKVLPRSVFDLDLVGPWAVFGPDQRLLAVYAAHGEDTVKPDLVLAT